VSQSRPRASTWFDRRASQHQRQDEPVLASVGVAIDAPRQRIDPADRRTSAGLLPHAAPRSARRSAPQHRLADATWLSDLFTATDAASATRPRGRGPIRRPAIASRLLARTSARLSGPQSPRPNMLDRYHASSAGVLKRLYTSAGRRRSTKFARKYAPTAISNKKNVDAIKDFRAACSTMSPVGPRPQALRGHLTSGPACLHHAAQAAGRLGKVRMAMANANRRTEASRPPVLGCWMHHLK